MSQFAITCGEPVSGDFVRVDNKYFPVMMGAPGEWIIDIDGAPVAFDGTQSGLVTALCVGLLQAGHTISEDDSVISLNAVSVIEQGTTFTVTEPEAEPEAVTSAFKQQMAADLDVFLNASEFADPHVIDGVTIVCLFDTERRDFPGAEGAFSADVPTLQAKTSDLAALPKGLPRIGKLLIVDGEPYRVTSAVDHDGMMTVEMERGS